MGFWMTTPRKMTVTPWSASHLSVVPERRAPPRFLPPAVLGLTGTLLLHSLALQSALMGSKAHKVDPLEIQQPGASLKSTVKSAESLVFVDLSGTVSTDHVNDQALTSLRMTAEKIPITLTLPDLSPPRDLQTLALEEEKPSAPSVDGGDGIERACLFGIYTGQIRARVERVWRRPRSPVSDPISSTNTVNTDESFQCQVQIVQDVKGYVQEVLLPNCNGSVAWQRSLVLAIRQASPLPAPPSPSVFSHSIPISFIALPYVVGAPEDDYETVLAKTVQANAGGATCSSRSPAEPWAWCSRREPALPAL